MTTEDASQSSDHGIEFGYTHLSGRHRAIYDSLCLECENLVGALFGKQTFDFFQRSNIAQWIQTIAYYVYLSVPDAHFIESV